MGQNHSLNKEGANGIFKPAKPHGLGMFVSFNEAKLITIQSINQSLLE